MDVTMTVEGRRILEPLRRPEVQAALSHAALACVKDGHEGCDDPASCDHPANLMSPVAFTAWLRLFLDPPQEERELRGGPGYVLSQDRRARWARKMRAARAATG